MTDWRRVLLAILALAAVGTTVFRSVPGRMMDPACWPDCPP
jgi:hypothetical protein